MAHALRADLLQLAQSSRAVFAIITDKTIRRGSFRSVRELTKKIDTFVSHYDENCKPFTWTATADSILEKLARLCGRITGTGH